jgi:hypothetical protein
MIDEHAARVAKVITENPDLYDQHYAVKPEAYVIKKSVDLDQLLGEVQCQAAQQRESYLVNTTVSLYRRLGLDSDELATAYDAVDKQARMGSE